MSRYAMNFQMMLVALALVLFAQRALACGGGSSSCSWKTCRETYSGYSPNPSTGWCTSLSLKPEELEENL